jgi:DNA-binding transcriptional LysR family regulator
MVYNLGMATGTQHLNLLPYFVRAAELSNFSAVAREMRVSAVAVSKAVAALEAHIGARLFQRSTRAVALTEEGRRLYEQCAGPIHSLRNATSVLSPQAESGCVRITCVPPFGKAVLIPMLPRFWRRYPNIRVDISLEARVVDMIAEGFDIGIRAGAPPPGDVVNKRLCGLSFVLCASPEFLAQHGVPKHVDALRQLPCLRQGSAETRGEFTWRLGPEREAQEVRLKARLSAPDLLTLEQAALAGAGIFQAPLPLVLPHFRTGALRPVLPETLRTGLWLHAYHRSSRQLPARTRATLDFLYQEVATHRDLQGNPEELCKPFWP